MTLLHRLGAMPLAEVPGLLREIAADVEAGRTLQGYCTFQPSDDPELWDVRARWTRETEVHVVGQAEP